MDTLHLMQCLLLRTIVFSMDVIHTATNVNDYVTGGIYFLSPNGVEDRRGRIGLGSSVLSKMPFFFFFFQDGSDVYFVSPNGVEDKRRRVRLYSRKCPFFFFRTDLSRGLFPTAPHRLSVMMSPVHHQISTSSAVLYNLIYCFTDLRPDSLPLEGKTHRQ